MTQEKTIAKNITIVSIDELIIAGYNPRTFTDKEYENLRSSIEGFGVVDPIIVNSAENRKNIVIGGHFRLKVAKELGFEELPVVYVNIPDVEKERELNLRLNRNLGEWDFDLLAKFDEDILKDVGFDTEELDKVYGLEISEPEKFDLQKELERLKIKQIQAQRGDLWALGDNRLLCGDSTKNILTEIGNMIDL